MGLVQFVSRLQKNCFTTTAVAPMNAATSAGVRAAPDRDFPLENQREPGGGNALRQDVRELRSGDSHRRLCTLKCAAQGDSGPTLPDPR